MTHRTVPKVTLVSRPRGGHGAATRTFIPERCHTAIGVLGGVAVATALALPGSAASAALVPGPDPELVRLEHPTGFLDVRVSADGEFADVRATVVRTARKLFDGEVMT